MGIKIFINKASGDITKIIQACTTAQKNTGKLIENAISQALIKPQDITPPNPILDSRNSWTSNSSYDLNMAKTNYNMPQQSNNSMYHLQRHYETHTSPHAYVNQESCNQTSFDFNQSLVELF